MAITDESENFPDHSTGRTTPKGWRVISNPARQPDPEADELKTLIQMMRKGRRPPVKQKIEETEPPEAA